MDNNIAFMDQQCTIEHEGQVFESGGAYIAKRKDSGKYSGAVYADDKKGVVTNWHGDIVIPAYFGPVFRGNMGDQRRQVWFTWQGINFTGRWCGMDNNQVVHVQEIK